LRALRLFTICTLTAALLTGPAAAQTSSTESSRPAANAWMLTPTPYPEWNKDISPSLRAARDRYADKVQGADFRKYPLTSPHSDALGPGIGDGIPKSDVRQFPNRVILAATFSGHRSVLSASEFSLYSEVSMHVADVFEDQGGSGVFTNEDITILISGGTVTLASGRVLSYDTQPVRFSLQPGHKYLLFLSYYGAGDFYLVMDDWDISDGTVRPNTRPGEYRAQHGLSNLSGVSAAQLGPALDKLLKDNR
jgi:hypothetical protein